MDEELKAALRPRPVALEAPMDLIAGRAKRLRVRTRVQWGTGVAAALVLVVALWTATMGSPLHRSGVEVDRAPKERRIHQPIQTARRITTETTSAETSSTGTLPRSGVPTAVEIVPAGPTPPAAVAPATTTTLAPARPGPAAHPRDAAITTTTTTVASPYPKQRTQVRLTYIVDDAGLHGPTSCACANEEIEILFLDQRVTTKYSSAPVYLSSDYSDPMEISSWPWSQGQELPIDYVVAGDYHLTATEVADPLGSLTLQITG